MTEVNAYELERQRRIDENRKRMAEMGLIATVNEIKETKNADIKNRNQKRAALKKSRGIYLNHGNYEKRRSDRSAGKAAPNYTSQMELSKIERSPPLRTQTRRNYNSSRIINLDALGWNPAKGEASRDAATAALDAAEDFVYNLEQEGRNALSKVMTSSQVSGGFWCNAPQGMNDFITFETKTQIFMRLPDDQEPPEDAAYVLDDGSWPVVWLPRQKQGYGFSGGWRAFSIDNDLYPSDVCVMEAASSDTLIIHIFRAFDYEQDAIKEQRVAAAAEAVEILNAEALEEAKRAAEKAAAVAEAAEPSEAATGTIAQNGSLNDLSPEATTDQDSPMETEEATEEEDGPAPVAAAAKKKNNKKNDAGEGPSKRKRQTRSSAAASDEEEEEDDAGKIVKRPRRAAVAKPASPAKKQAPKTKKGGKKAATKKTTTTAKKKTTPKKKQGKKAAKAPETPPPSDSEDEEEGDDESYFVEYIRGVRTLEDGTKQYHIKWWGYSLSESSWEPIEMLDNPPESYEWLFGRGRRRRG